MLDIKAIAQELRTTIAIGQEVVTIGYYPTHICKALKEHGFLIRSTDDGVLYYAHIRRFF